MSSQWLQWHPLAPVLLAGTVDGDVWMWKIPDGDTKTFQGHGCTVGAGKVMPDGNQFSIHYITLKRKIFCPLMKNSSLVRF